MRAYFSFLLLSGCLVCGMSLLSARTAIGETCEVEQEALVSGGDEADMLADDDHKVLGKETWQEAGNDYAADTTDESLENAADFDGPEQDAQFDAEDDCDVERPGSLPDKAGDFGSSEPNTQLGTDSNAEEPDFLPEGADDSIPLEQDIPLELATDSNALETDICMETATDSNASAFLASDIQPEIAAVSTIEELAEWLASLDGQGGEVKLDETITLTETIWPNEDQSEPIIIHTGAFGLIYDGGYISALELELVGDGVDMPVLEIRSTSDGYGWFAPPDWNNTLSVMDVTSVGRGGKGGVAVKVTADRDTRTPVSNYERRGNIHSYGIGAVGLLLTPDQPVNTYFMNIDVEGENAHTVAAPNGADFFCCQLSAEGDGAVIATGGNIILDTCQLSSEPEGVTVIQRSIEKRVGVETQIEQNIVPEYIYDEPLSDIQRYLLTGGRYLDFYLVYNSEEIDALDTSVLGKIDIPVSLPEYLQGLGLEGGKDLTFRVWVRDPALPIIQNVQLEDGILTFFSWYGVDLEPETILWCSVDDCVTWTDITDNEAVMWNYDPIGGDLFQLEVDKIDRPVWLALENKAGRSNVIALTPGEDGVITPGTGGDRDGGDREELPGSEGGEHDSGGSGSFGGGSSDSGSSGSCSSGIGPGNDNPAGSESFGNNPSSSVLTDGVPPDNGSSDTGPSINGYAEEGSAPNTPSKDMLPNMISPTPSGTGTGNLTESATSLETPMAPNMADAQSPSANSPASNPYTESPEADTALSAHARPFNSTILLLPALALSTAGGVTALTAFRKKRGNR